MRKYLKSKKVIIFFIFLFFLSGAAGITVAQTKMPSADSTFDVDMSSPITPDDSTALRNEIETIEKSIEEVAKELEILDATINKQRSILLEPKHPVISIPRKELIKRNLKETTFTENVEFKDEKEQVIQTQTRELLRILKEKDVVRIEELMKEIKNEGVKRDRHLLKEPEKEDIGGGARDDEFKSILEDDFDMELKLELEEISDVKDIEEETIKKAQNLERIISKKKQNVVKRARAVRGNIRALEEVLKDFDEDGISDYDEINIYETDPFLADSDGDGYVDGAEILSGFDPLSDSLNAIIKYENPKKRRGLEKDFFSISRVEIKETGVVKDGEEIINKMYFEGKALPNSFVTIYIFSIPIIVTVKTDNDGNWNYTLDKELEDGEHEIYVAMTDNSGKILAKSNSVPFVKEAAAVTVDEKLLSFRPEGVSPGFFNGGYLFITILLLMFITGATLVFIGMRSKNVNEDSDNLT